MRELQHANFFKTSLSGLDQELLFKMHEENPEIWTAKHLAAFFDTSEAAAAGAIKLQQISRQLEGTPLGVDFSSFLTVTELEASSPTLAAAEEVSPGVGGVLKRLDELQRWWDHIKAQAGLPEGALLTEPNLALALDSLLRQKDTDVRHDCLVKLDTLIHTIGVPDPDALGYLDPSSGAELSPDDDDRAAWADGFAPLPQPGGPGAGEEDGNGAGGGTAWSFGDPGRQRAADRDADRKLAAAEAAKSRERLQAAAAAGEGDGALFARAFTDREEPDEDHFGQPLSPDDHPWASIHMQPEARGANVAARPQARQPWADESQTLSRHAPVSELRDEDADPEAVRAAHTVNAARRPRLPRGVTSAPVPEPWAETVPTGNRRAKIVVRDTSGARAQRWQQAIVRDTDGSLRTTDYEEEASVSWRLATGEPQAQQVDAVVARLLAHAARQEKATHADRMELSVVARAEAEAAAAAAAAAEEAGGDSEGSSEAAEAESEAEAEKEE